MFANAYRLAGSKFQLHHTGIKTRKGGVGKNDLLKNFNCTIQELKPLISGGQREFAKTFQLHHTGIKTS